MIEKDKTNYFVMLNDDGSVLLLFRLRHSEEGLHREGYQKGEGWVDDHRAADVFTNGQDYDLIDAAEADRLIAIIEATPE